MSKQLIKELQSLRTHFLYDLSPHQGRAAELMDKTIAALSKQEAQEPVRDAMSKVKEEEKCEAVGRAFFKEEFAHLRRNLAHAPQPTSQVSQSVEEFISAYCWTINDEPVVGDVVWVDDLRTFMAGNALVPIGSIKLAFDEGCRAAGQKKVESTFRWEHSKAFGIEASKEEK